MIEVTNNTKGPVQLIVKAKGTLREFRTINVPAIGKGKNVLLLEDERATEYIDRIRRTGMISVRYVTGQKNKGE